MTKFNQLVTVFCRRSFIALALSLAAITSLTMATSAFASSDLRVSVPFDFKSLDPAKMKVGSEYCYALLVFNGLTHIDREMKVQPDLAESWSVSDDLKRWDFKLRQGVTFHNGKTLDANDILYTYERLRDKEVGSRMRGNLGMVDKVEAIGNQTVRFTLNEPYGDFPAIVADYQGRIIPAGSADTIATKPVGTGPFKFVEFVAGDRLVVEKNPNYWEKGLPKLDKVTLRVILEPATSTAALKSGEIDIVWSIIAEQQKTLGKVSSVRVDEIPSGTWTAVVMRNDIPPFNDLRVRQAVFNILDKSVIADVAALGTAVPTHTPIPPSHPAYNNDIKITRPDFEKAKRLLKEAGYDNGLDLKLWFPVSDSEAERMSVVLRDLGKKAGINIELQGAQIDKFYDEIEGKEPFATTLFYGRPTPDTMLYAWYHSEGSWNKNLWHYSNPKVDKILTDARRTSDAGKQKELYAGLQEVLVKEGPGAVFYVQKHANGVSNRVQNFKSHPRLWMELKEVSLN